MHSGGGFFAHCPPENIGFSKRVTSNDVGDLENLLLVDDDTVGFLEDELEIGMEVLNILRLLLALDKVRDKRHWTRPVEGNESDDIGEKVRTQLFGQAAHT